MIQRYQKGSRMSQAVSYGGLVYIAGQVAENRKAGIEAQTLDVLGKIDALLKEAGTDRSKLLAVNVFLPAIVDFDAMNGVYDAWIDPENPPARACVEARLADPFNWRPRGGESYRDLMERIVGWLESLEGNAVVVSHGGMSRVLRGHLLGIDPSEVPFLEVPQDKVLVLRPGEISWH